MANNILVLGAGELGNAILTYLSQKRSKTTKITVLFRPSTISSTDPAKRADIARIQALDIAILPGDISGDTPAALSALFKPFDLIVSCLGFASGPGSQIKLAKAVLDAGVKRYFPWQFGVDYDAIGRGSAQDLFDEQLDVRDLLRRQSATEWVIVSTGMFTSFLFEAYFGVVDLSEGEGVVRALGSWENQVTVTTPEDIGRLTAEIVFEAPRVVNQIVYTAGETISYGRLAEVVEEVTGKRPRREVWSVDKLKADWRADPKNPIKKYRVVFAEGKGVSWEVEKTFNWRKKIAVVDVRSWALENLAGNSKSQKSQDS